MTKKQKLIRLRSKVIDKIYKERWEDVWFFPEYNGVKGYLGTQNIIFLCINPSTGAFPSWADNIYYRNLKKQGFANAHLTDFFKQRAKNWKDLAGNKKLIKEAKQILLEEIDIIKPRLIVLVGLNYRRFYEEILKDVEIEKFSTSHYAFRYGNRQALRVKMRQEIKRQIGDGVN